MLYIKFKMLFYEVIDFIFYFYMFYFVFVEWYVFMILINICGVDDGKDGWM